MPSKRRQSMKRPPGKTAEELQEEEELQLALALSQSEAEQKEKERKSRSHIAPDPTPHHPTVSPTPSSVSASPEHTTQTTSELSRYLDRSYWEQRLSRDTALAPTAPAPTTHASEIVEDFPKASTNKQQDDDAEDKEIDEFVESLKSQVEIFVNRMKSNSSRGRSIANDTAVQTLFMNITAMHSRLLRYIQQQDDKRVYLESLQDKVTQIRDSRAALDTLRAEHAARLAAQAEAAERQRQMQMAAKLQAMRKKKHEYLQYQRQLALQRVQEQEREMQMRQEQQKHQYLMSANSYYIPGVSMQQYPSGYPNQPIYGNPQFHPQMMAQATTESSVPIPGQPQMSTANMPMNMNTQLGNIQSMPQMSNTYGITTTAANAMNPSAVSSPSMNQSNLRPALGQQLPLQQQMLLQQMHQMRMPVQPGMHQILSQGIANGLPGQPLPQTNGQNVSLPKQNLPNQPQQPPNSMMPQMSVNQNMGQTMMNPNNPMMGLQMQNMRMPIVQGNQPNASNQQVPVSQFQNMNIQNQPNNQQPVSQGQTMQPHSQMNMAGQALSLQSQQLMQGQTFPGQPQSMQINNNMLPANQNIPPQGQQVPQTQGQQMSQQMQHLQMQHNQQVMQQPGQQIMMPPGHQIPNQAQNIQQQGQMINQGQTPQGQLPQQGQQMPQQMGQGQQLLQGQQIPQGQQMAQLPPGQQLPQGQQMPQGPQVSQGQQMPQGHLPGPQTHQIQMVHQVQMGPMAPQLPPGQTLQGQSPQQITGQQMQEQQPQSVPGQIKVQQPILNNMAHGQPQTNNQQAQTPVKSEHNNNTAELISFD
ncbi:unnamed protein product [Arctia plantaginis]|uniref:Hepatocyte growth factor-regulated tyrosine kinase substrate helical domain-containing protein n=1 Tax=Arctia plantaginis TaxID=874455 RepID=A0A8S0ZA15_ARCPL|nr:unnamed protein product [Arctia plantaginis]